MAKSKKKASPFTVVNGTVTWENKAGDLYQAIGTDREGKPVDIRNTSWPYINGINLYQGKKVLIRGHQKHVIQEVSN